MPAVGDTKVQFNRTYIWLEPNVDAPGSWRLTGNDNTPGASQDQSVLNATGTVDAGTPTILINQLVYVTSTGTLALANASSINTAKVAGVATATATAGNPVTYTRNRPITMTNVSTVVDSAPATLENGKYYYLSATNAGNYTRTPDTTTSGAALVQVGLALGTADMAIEIQSEVLI
jgi:hypothetical protein